MMAMERRGFEEYDWRGHYDNNYAGTGKGFAQMESAYQYGYDLAYDDQYSAAEWSTIQEDARMGWEERYPDRDWDEVRDVVRYAWVVVTTGDEGYAGTGKGFAQSQEPDEL